MASSRGFDEEENGDRRQGDYNRPRRPNPDTIAYLRSLPLDVKTSEEELSRFLSPSKEQKSDGDEEYPQTLSAALSAIDEIRNEIASLAGDEYGAQCIEVLARIAVPYSEVAARTLLYGLSTYHLHLATHRYGSHVVQTILELSVASSTEQDMSLHDDAPQLSQTSDQLPSLSDLILVIVDELMPHVSQLTIHICGSHVLRTLVCVLGGVKLVSETKKPAETAMRRGRVKSKKKKKKMSSDNSSNPPHAGMMGIEYQSPSRLDLDDSTENALSSLTEALCRNRSSTEGPGELQQMACHPSAGPLLIVLLRVLTYSRAPDMKLRQQQSKENEKIADFRLGILKAEPTFEHCSHAHRLAQQILCWQPSASSQQHAGEVIYGLSGEPRGSHVLETLLRISSDQFYASILECGRFDNATSMQEYVEHDVSNFVVQTLLSTVRSKDQAAMLWKSIERAVSTGCVLDSRNRRRGILWRAAEMASKHGVCQEGILKAIRIGMGLSEKSREETTTEESEAVDDGKKKKKRQKASSLPMQDCVVKLVDLKPPEMDGGRVMLDAAGARALYHLLRFEPRLCSDLLDGIVENFSREELVLIARDGLGSRCIMDGILDGPRDHPAFARARKKLLEKLGGQWVALAVDRVGNHSVKKLFRGLTEWEDKAVLTAELAQALSRLGGVAMGRSVIEACAVHEFLEGEEAWKTAVRKSQQREEFLEDILATGEKDAKSEKKKKRKRKKHGREPTEPDSQEHSKKSRTENASKVESIMNVISASTQ